uniref:Syntaxin binding protein 6 (amisyn) n=1 Tax=Oncorhynchus mykiss TaxID=8022 RepID=A0A8C7UMZ1_ONCMY
MSAKSAINKAVFTPHDEKMLAAVQVKRRTKKKIPFLATGGQGDYMTFICLSVTNKKPSHVSITKVKQFPGSSSFAKRSMWTIDQLRQVNGCDPNKDCPEFDLAFDNAFDQWVAGSAGEKCTFIQILHHTCQRYSSQSKPEFVNCQPMGLRTIGPGSSGLGEGLAGRDVVPSRTSDSCGGPGTMHADTVARCTVFLPCHCDCTIGHAHQLSPILFRKKLLVRSSVLTPRSVFILHSAADSVTSAVQKASQALNERGERLSRAEEKTGEMKNSVYAITLLKHNHTLPYSE